MIDVDAVILGSGLSKRMESNKLLLDYEGKTVIERVVLAVLKANCFKNVLVVVKDREVEEILAKYNVKTIFNPNYKHGKSTSIHLGLMILGESHGTMFLVGDQPFVDSDSILNLWCEFIQNKDNILVPYINRTMGKPIIFPKSLYGELLNLKGENGVMDVLKNNEGIIKKVRVSNYKLFFDMDTKEDYEVLLSNLI
ncbi:MAG: NTP transferase domain-containing protein [Clostridium perfringens]|nr:NTP transferase domain-containing protein [Clostridium perfringens]